MSNSVSKINDQWHDFHHFGFEVQYFPSHTSANNQQNYENHFMINYCCSKIHRYLKNVFFFQSWECIWYLQLTKTCKPTFPVYTAIFLSITNTAEMRVHKSFMRKPYSYVVQNDTILLWSKKPQENISSFFSQEGHDELYIDSPQTRLRTLSKLCWCYWSTSAAGNLITGCCCITERFHFPCRDVFQ